MEIAAGIILVLVALGLLFWIVVMQGLRKPSLNREWRSGFAYLSEGLFEGPQVTMTNVRDWRYDGKQIISQDWRDITYDLGKIKDLYFMIEPFDSWNAVGHGFAMFTFADGKTLVFSVEARMTKGQKYTALDGMRNKFELGYAWGTAEDFVVRRAVYLEHDLRMHRLNLPLDGKLRLLQGFIYRTNKLARRPRFYNTLFHNCTNELAYVANQTRPGSVPFAWAYFLTGFSDKTLYDLGFFRTVFDTWEDHKANSDVADVITNNHKQADWFERVEAHLRGQALAKDD